MIKTGLIGHPVSHSKSPIIHEHWMNVHRIHGTYTPVDLPCDQLGKGIESLIAQGYKGFNVTVPHKVDIMKFCDSLDPLAKIVGAVNTVIINNGKLHGTNTDVFGFIENIRTKAPAFDFSGGRALVLGAGGAARGVVQGLLNAGVPEILLANRTQAKTEILIAHSSAPEKIKLVNWDIRDHANTLADLNFLVNTTALGMDGQMPLRMDLTHLHPHALVNDIVYAPLMTELLKNALGQGNMIVTGIGMLLHQARPAFKLWHGIMPGVDQTLEEMVLA